MGDNTRSRSGPDPHVRAPLAAEGPRRRPCAHRPPRPAGDGVRRAGRTAAHHRPLHHHPLPCRVRRLGTIPDPRARPRLLTRTDDRRHDPPPGRSRWQSRASHRTGLDARHPGRRDHGPGRAGPAGVRGRSTLEADPDRVHDRAGAHHRRGPAAKALRVLGQLRQPDRGHPGIRSRCHVRRDGRRRPARRIVRPGGDPCAPAVAAEGTRRPGRRGPVDRCRRGVRSPESGRLAGGNPAQGFPALHHPERSRFRTSLSSSGAHSASPSWLSPIPSRPPRPLRHAVATRSGRTRR